MSGRVAPEPRREQGVIRRRDVADRSEPALRQALLGDLADAPQARRGQRRQEGTGLVGPDDDQAVGFLQVARDLRGELAAGHADRGHQVQPFRTSALIERADRLAVAEQALLAGDVEERLVERQPFDERR